MKLEIEIVRVTHCQAKEGGRFWVRLYTDTCICSGNMRWEPKAGERLTLDGKWEVYHGQKQFQFFSAVPNVPTDNRALLKYAAKLTVGVGDKMEEKLWETFGGEWMEKLETVKPGDIKGLSETILANLRLTVEAIQRDGQQFKAISWLMGLGATQGLAEKAWAQWASKLVGMVQDDPYCLAQLPHCGFATVDTKIRLNLGIKDQDPKRVRAGVLYVLGETLDQDGATLCPVGLAIAKAVETLSLPVALVSEAMARLLMEGKIMGMQHIQAIGVAKDFENEQIILEYAKCH